MFAMRQFMILLLPFALVGILETVDWTHHLAPTQTRDPVARGTEDWWSKRLSRPRLAVNPKDQPQ